MISDPAGVRERLEQITQEAEARNAELKRQIAEIETTASSQDGRRASEITVEGDISLKIGDNKASRVIRATANYNALLSVFQAVCGPTALHMGYKTALNRFVWVRNDYDVKFLFTLYIAEKLTGLELVSLAAELIAPLDKFNLRKEHTYRARMPVFFVDCAGPDSTIIWLSFPPTQAFDPATQTLKQIFGEFTSLSYTDDDGDSVLIDGQDSWDYALAVGGRIAPLGRYPLLVVKTPLAE
jgi:hypothetical protein